MCVCVCFLFLCLVQWCVFFSCGVFSFLKAAVFLFLSLSQPAIRTLCMHGAYQYRTIEIRTSERVVRLATSASHHLMLNCMKPDVSDFVRPTPFFSLFFCWIFSLQCDFGRTFDRDIFILIIYECVRVSLNSGYIWMNKYYIYIIVEIIISIKKNSNIYFRSGLIVNSRFTLHDYFYSLFYEHRLMRSVHDEGTLNENYNLIST